MITSSFIHFLADDITTFFLGPKNLYCVYIPYLAYSSVDGHFYKCLLAVCTFS